MRKNIIRKMLVTSGLLLFVTPIAMPKNGIKASANSAQTYWSGVDGTGAIVMDEHCPIEVQHEKLVFDIPEFPANHYQDVEDFVAYNANVSATYTFYNPADYTVKATLAFPFGQMPYYAPYIYDEEEQMSKPYLDTDKYDITVNGEVIEKKTRFTLSGAFDAFDIVQSLPYLGATYVEDDFYKADLPVTIYHYEVSGISEAYKSAYASFVANFNPAKTRIMLNNHNGIKTVKDGAQLGKFVGNGHLLSVYIFGEQPATLPEWTIYEDAGQKKIINGVLQEKTSKRYTITFEEFVFNDYFGAYQSSVSKIDWYNSVVYALNESQEEFGVVADYNRVNVSDFMRWYQYEIEIPAKSTIVNTVTAPLHPSINLKWTPAVFGYTYLLSPAKTWTKFGNLDIEIHTPYYIIDDKNGFTKTQTGYELSLDGLPNGELEFTLSTDANAQPPSTFGCYSSLGACVYSMPFVLSAIVLLFKKRK